MSVLLPERASSLVQGSGSQLFSMLARALAQAPVLPDLPPGSVASRLPESPPQEGVNLEQVIEDFLTTIRPTVMKSNAVGNLSYIPLSVDFPAFVGACLAAGLNQSRALWRLSPAATEVEQVVLDWLRQLLGFPSPLFGMIHHNSAVLESLVAAREVLPALHIRQFGMPGRQEVPRLRLYASQEAHSSVEKAALVLGIGEQGLRKIGTDSSYCLNVEELEQAITEDKENGWLPFAVVATVGTTSTGSIDPVPQIAEICERNALWLHVDAAFGGWAALLPERRAVLAGCEQADSLSINAHKSLGAPVGTSLLYTRRPSAYKAAFALTPEYLRTNENELNLSDYTHTLPHGFPALALWTLIRTLGQRGLQARIRGQLDLARRLACWLDEQEEIERMAPSLLQVVCFRFHPQGMDEEERLEAFNQQALSHINARGRLALSSTRLLGRFVLRVAFGAMQSDESILPLFQQEVQLCLEEITKDNSAGGASIEKEAAG